MVAIDAGRLDRLVRVLELRQTPEGWAWAERRKAWAMVEGESGRSLFSSIGLGARAYKLTLRRQGLTLHNAILWEGRHLFLTQIDPLGRGHLEVRSAAVQVSDCVAQTYTQARDPAKGNRPQRVAGPAVAFPGVVTEKYIGYDREETHGEITRTMVLVTPKAVELDEGDVVTVAGNGAGRYHVTAVHLLDTHKNEYEMTRREDK